MPRYDGTGPSGEGPMSGHGGGYCITPVHPGILSRGAGRGLAPYGGGMGRCFGGGRGRAWSRRTDAPETRELNGLKAENRRLKALVEELQPKDE